MDEHYPGLKVAVVDRRFYISAKRQADIMSLRADHAAVMTSLVL